MTSKLISNKMLLLSIEFAITFLIFFIALSRGSDFAILNVPTLIICLIAVAPIEFIRQFDLLGHLIDFFKGSDSKNKRWDRKLESMKYKFDEISKIISSNQYEIDKLRNEIVSISYPKIDLYLFSIESKSAPSFSKFISSFVKEIQVDKSIKSNFQDNLDKELLRFLSKIENKKTMNDYLIYSIFLKNFINSSEASNISKNKLLEFRDILMHPILEEIEVSNKIDNKMLLDYLVIIGICFLRMGEIEESRKTIEEAEVIIE